MNDSFAGSTTSAPCEPPAIEFISYRRGRCTDSLGIIGNHDAYFALDALLAETAKLTVHDIRNHVVFVVHDVTLQKLLREQFGHEECDTCRELNTLTVALSDYKATLGHDVERKPW